MFSKKTWQDRRVEYPNRRRFVSTSDSNVKDITREEGTIYTAGDKFNAQTMNDLETRISSEFSNTQTSIDDIAPRRISAFTISSSSVSSISNQSWDTERKYGFRGYKSVSGMTSNSKVDIVCDDPTSNIVGIAETTNGGFYIYCSEKKDLKVLEATWIRKVGS